MNDSEPCCRGLRTYRSNIGAAGQDCAVSFAVSRSRGRVSSPIRESKDGPSQTGLPAWRAP
jgi:hypothetical protein